MDSGFLSDDFMPTKSLRQSVLYKGRRSLLICPLTERSDCELSEQGKLAAGVTSWLIDQVTEWRPLREKTFLHFTISPIMLKGRGQSLSTALHKTGFWLIFCNNPVEF